MKRLPYAEKKSYVSFLHYIFHLYEDITSGSYAAAFALLRDINERVDIRSSGTAEIVIETLSALLDE